MGFWEWIAQYQQSGRQATISTNQKATEIKENQKVAGIYHSGPYPPALLPAYDITGLPFGYFMHPDYSDSKLVNNGGIQMAPNIRTSTLPTKTPEAFLPNPPVPLVDNMLNNPLPTSLSKISTPTLSIPSFPSIMLNMLPSSTVGGNITINSTNNYTTPPAIISSSPTCTPIPTLSVDSTSKPVSEQIIPAPKIINGDEKEIPTPAIKIGIDNLVSIPPSKATQSKQIFEKVPFKTTHIDGNVISKISEVSEDKIQPNPLAWDGWPDGDWDRLYSYQEFEQSNSLSSHWAMKIAGGDRRGDLNATIATKGKVTRRLCQGILKCNNPKCEILVRPQTTDIGVTKQLQKPCICGSNLNHLGCNIESRYYRFQGGVFYKNGGFHTHPRPPRLLHLLPAEQKQFQNIVQSQPKTGALKLAVGVGAGPSTKKVTDISPIFLNLDRIRYEKSKVIEPSTNSLGLDGITEFDQKYPGFLKASHIGAITVLSFQTAWMSLQLLQETVLSEPVNGFVTDAAHNYWRTSDLLLIITSIYSRHLRRWVPTLFSYANGGTTDHYRLHFLTLFNSLKTECERNGSEISDKMFAMVMDFSVAQSNGFTSAFIQFWQQFQGDARTASELQAVSDTLLKGCEQHFRTGVTRLKKISGVIKPTLADTFEKQALGLIDAESIAEFNSRANTLRTEFPGAIPWLQWWRQEAPARKLFKAFRIMDDETWAKLPATTNAEEALHFSLYCASGKKLGLLEGFEGLYRYADWLVNQSIATSTGIPTNYGQKEPWKQTAAKFGRTKISRNSKKPIPNDGRPPDTAKALMTRKGTGLHLPGYSWTRNSCWLDTSLELLYRSLHPSHKELMQAFKESSPETVLGTLYYLLSERYRMEIDGTVEYGTLLSLKRDQFRGLLFEATLIQEQYSQNSLFGWLDGALRKLRDTGDKVATLFETHIMTIRTCISRDSVKGHSVLDARQIRRGCHMLNIPKHGEFQGNLQKWFQHSIGLVPDSNTTCWKNSGDQILCEGTATLMTLWVSLPIILIVEFEDGSSIWNTPKTLQGASHFRDIKYNSMGKAHFNQLKSHFTATFHADKYVYEHDGMTNSGDSIRVPKVSLPGYGSEIREIPISAVVYTLENGAGAQELFQKIQADLLNQNLNLTLETLQSGQIQITPNPVFCSIIPASERTWMKDTSDTRLTDYTWSHSHTIMTPKKPQTTPKNITPISRKPPRTPKKTHFNDTIQNTEMAYISNNHPIPTNKQPVLYPETGTNNDMASPIDMLKPNLTLDSLGNVSTSSEFPIACRCGFHGDGYQLGSEQEDEQCIQCWTCKQWSHIACQPDAQCSNLLPTARFTCHSCDIPSEWRNIFRPKSYRKENQVFIELSKQPLHQRLLAGKGVLICHQKYYYPGRLILYNSQLSQWRVEWWRMNEYKYGPPATSLIPVENIVDCLWNDRKARRLIRLGKWKMACTLLDDEETILNFKNISVSEEIQKILTPHKAFIQKLLLEPKKISPTTCPALAYLQGSSIGFSKVIETTQKKNGIIPFTGNLSIEECAMVNAYIYRHLQPASTDPYLWFQKAPAAHAITLIILHREFGNSVSPESEEFTVLLARSWDLQINSVPAPRHIDIAREALTLLERRMFETSKAAGSASYEQWGLDSGAHQDNWSPYQYIPAEWNLGDYREPEETEYLPGPEFSEGSSREEELPLMPSKPRPKARMLPKLSKRKTTGEDTDTEMHKPIRKRRKVS